MPGPTMKRALLVALVVCVLASPAEAGRRRRGGFARGGGIRGMLAEARATMAEANETMRNAQRTMRSAEVMAKDPELQAAMAASERVLRLQIELERLQAQRRAEKE